MSQKENNMDKYFHHASAADFHKIPGSPIAYWSSDKTFDIFSNKKNLSEYVKTAYGLITMDNSRFVRYWTEVSLNKASFHNSETDAWVPFNNGGDFRRWYGNNDSVVNWLNDGEEIKKYALKKNGSVTRTVVGQGYYFRPGMTWNAISAGNICIRYFREGFIFSNASMCAFGDTDAVELAGALLNSKVGLHFLKILAPTVNFGASQVALVPILSAQSPELKDVKINQLLEISKRDWDSYEISWDFSGSPLLNSSDHVLLLKDIYHKLRYHWAEIIKKMQYHEEENNRLFIDAYSLQDELAPEVPISEITLTCNPHYRYGGNLTDNERETRLQSDTIAELISYIIGCMMGRYSLDREGLVYAHASNENFKTLVEEGAYTSFPADSDGILPLTSEAWFEDDIAARVEEFVSTVWGTEHLEENLQFIADSLCLAAIKPVKKGGETSRETIRRYLSTQFFKDHLKTYKKRPIYWLFSSGKEKAFECLVYLHRYNETTLPRMRTEYVTPLLGQMDSRIERLRLQQNEAETAEAKRIGKEIDSLTKQLTELRSFDDQLKHYADMKIQLDLDDGVKVNYGKFGTLLAEVKAITGDKAE
ncbi:TPA: BREX-1 system adenine-specific DNA-methyltransferase PglX [Raoultella ornithinolytica]|uniref:BREX-1 system adenine-specific DNA-methyltransferase PglX n=2 Tax=Raoultella TaxID=160674 RepID=UPI000CF33CA6|nr:BREX-1 system adenine-specific DNA-methyltransferase PglX [Raoultella ornithinolytica]EKU8631550.1 BREX-1 system adenine-specific DNA-methyltransferase PglX [Raoultella ornithinolytica]MCF6684937.1 BREX-1 system adenine-specific DNA-methyltransferase PglX [Raoultella ornithinolytica]MCF6710642.1 BREX-1 system adenine-specific DNA-methyltransferase PglX [Raoultella ornithinolytica]MCZ0884881.1 BREX-1 system adenine-specific DNA-methyltransferase PglX [Raoultella ornithinolytica]PQH21206.1 cl